MNKKNIKSAESYALDRDDKNHFSFALFSFYYILPLLCFFMALGLFVFRFVKLNIRSDMIEFFILGMISVSAVTLGLLFYGRSVFSRRQLIKRVNLMNITMLGLLMLASLSYLIFVASSFDPALQSEFLSYILFVFMSPFLAPSIIFFFFTSLSYFVLISLPPQLFKKPQNNSHLKRNTLIFYVIFLILYYSSSIFSIIAETFLLDGPLFFKDF